MVKTLPLPRALAKIYEAVKELEQEFGRKFTPDGHLIGSIGEVIAQKEFRFELLKMSAPVHDAKCKVRGFVQIKTTAGDGVQIKKGCNHLLVLKIHPPTSNKEGYAEVIYDGKGDPVWKIAGKANKSEEKWVSIKALKQLNEPFTSRQNKP
jgi:hypothetical protein